MVLHLHGAPALPATLEPAAWYRLTDGQLLGPNDSALLAYQDGYWAHEGRRFTTVVCEGPVSLHFERAVEGPFQSLTLAGAVLWCDDLSLARYEAEAHRWRRLQTGETFTGVVWR